MDRSRLKKTLEQEVQAQAKAFSDWKQPEGVHTFEEIEAKALEIAQEVAQAPLSYGVADEQQVERQKRSEAEPSCPGCGRPMRYGGQPGKTINSKAGEISFKRDYYHCPACGAGLFPPGPTLGGGRGELE
jgi:ribosomal protein S27AE